MEGATLAFLGESIWINGSTNVFIISHDWVNFDEYIPENTGILIIFLAELKQNADHS